MWIVPHKSAEHFELPRVFGFKETQEPSYVSKLTILAPRTSHWNLLSVSSTPFYSVLVMPELLVGLLLRPRLQERGYQTFDTKSDFSAECLFRLFRLPVCLS